MGAVSNVVLGAEATNFLFDAEYWHLEHTMEHQLSNAGISIDSVPEFQYWMWRLRSIVGCRRSKWAL
jgi:hypothetical protein